MFRRHLRNLQASPIVPFMFPLGNLFRLFRPRLQCESFRERLERARIEARRFAARHALDTDESAVVLSAWVNSAILSQADADWRENSVAELERFRTVRRIRGSTANQEVDFIEESDWPDPWRTERRLRIVYVPELAGENERRKDYSVGGSYLEVGNGNLTADLKTVCSLTFIDTFRRSAPVLWKGSEVSIRESDRALELKGIGGNFTDSTVVNAVTSLAAPTFDCAKAMMEGAAATCPSDQKVWLAIGLPLDADTPMPTPRPIGREDVIDAPVILKRSGSRLYLEVFQAPRTFNEPPADPRTVTRIMAVERP